ncbi:MAG TPA: hypothetical protein VFD37_04070 [Solirubrobacterales bacterium]|nr:hypothetical protein [Solirubrobacterales bacterium]
MSNPVVACSRATTTRIAAVAALAMLSMLAGYAGSVTSADAAPRSTPVDIRVLTADGRTVADHRQYTADIGLRTDRRADCFGEGTGGSGKTVRVPGLTALGVLAQAARHDKRLRPIQITDHDFGFPGLGLCGIGGPIPPGEFWFIKADHENPQVSGDAAKVRPGGSVLWFRMPFTGCQPDPPYACAPELVLSAPARTRPGAALQVRVTAYDDGGRRTPVAGARVTGAGQPTDARGRTTVTLGKSARIRASLAGHVPSSLTAVCVNARLAKCPPARGMRIIGSHVSDRIVGTRGPDLIRTGPGDNRVNVRGGGRDRVVCGGGRNVVIADRSDALRGCGDGGRARRR